MPASPPSTDTTVFDADRQRVRLGFALTHPTAVLGLALGADATVGIVGAALLALHGLVELHWHLVDRTEDPTGIPVAAVYDGPS